MNHLPSPWISTNMQNLTTRPANPHWLNARLRESPRGSGQERELLVGSSPAIDQVRRLVALFAIEPDPVLITGATGAGKEAAARALQRAGYTPDGPFVVVSTGSISGTGLTPERHWREFVAEACGGTLLLDEVSDGSDEVQAKLVEIIDACASERLRVVATSRRDLLVLISEGYFREELWHRLSVLPIEVPSLSKRVEDIGPLADLELQRIWEGRGGDAYVLEESAYEALRAQPWPGNVREVQSTVRRMAILSKARRTLDRYDVDRALQLSRMESKPSVRYERKEREQIVEVLNAHGWNVSATARALGMSRGRLRGRMARLGIE